MEDFFQLFWLGFVDSTSFAYAITSMGIAFIVGYLSQRGWMSSLFRTMSMSVFVTIFCVLVSCPLDFFFTGGKLGNVWGQGVADLFSRWGIPFVLSVVLGQFYVDFLDKVLSEHAFPKLNVPRACLLI